MVALKHGVVKPRSTLYPIIHQYFTVAEAPVCVTIKAMRRTALFTVIIIIITAALLPSGCARSASTVTLTAKTPEPAPEPTAEPAEAPRYTIAWISDTQHYSNRFPDTFYAMTEYLRDNADSLDLRYIAHTGDLVHRAGSERQWEVAQRAMAAIADIPAGVCAGNHDVGTDDADYSAFSRYFGEAEASLRECYADSFEDNRGHCDLIDAGETRFVFIYIGYQIEQSGIEWVKQMLEKYSDRVAVICTHAYFDTDLSLLEDGELLKREVVSQYPNVYMVLSGHRYNIACVEDSFDDDGDGEDDRTVYQMICNYQAADSEGGSGYMMLFGIDEAAGLIHCKTYSPLLDDYVLFDDIPKEKGRYGGAPEYEDITLKIPWR